MPSRGRSACTGSRVFSRQFTLYPAGKYALAVIHDENMNAKLNTNARGSPTEGYSFSNDVKGLFGAPAFSAASFADDERVLELTIGLQY